MSEKLVDLGTYRVVIKEQHVDVYGHLNNSSYFYLFEEARWEFITAQGYGLLEIMRVRQGPILLEAHIMYKKEISVREVIDIKSELIEYVGKVGRMKQSMVKADGSIAAEAVFTLGLFDLDKRKLVLPNEGWKKAIGISV
jgi:acyl-CoA thioester hydrolase